MRVAFVAGNRETLPDPVIPLGLLMVASSLPSRHPQTIIDLCFEDDPEATLRASLADFRPDVVALGMRNIQNADYSGSADTLAYYEGLMSTIRSATPCPIVIGGSGFSVMPAQLMRRLRPDYGISGEAEASFPALIEILEQGGDPDSVGGLHRWVDGECRSNPVTSGFLDMDSLPIADRSRVDRRHYEHCGIDAIQTKRGCPLLCEYCTYPTIEGRVGRLRSPERVAEEFEAVLRHEPDLKHVFIVDSVFNLPRRHAKDVCRALMEREIDVPWTCYANPLGFDAELAGLMKEAGCAGMEVGSDSGSDRMLERLKKGFTTEQIRTFSSLAREAGVPDCHTFLLGTPGETIDDVLRTLDFIVELDPFGAILMAWVDDYEAIDPDLATERRKLRERVLELLDERRGEFPWWSIPSIGVNFDASLFATLRKRGYHGPLWQHLRGLTSPAMRRRKRSAEPASRSLRSGRSL